MKKIKITIPVSLFFGVASIIIFILFIKIFQKNEIIFDYNIIILFLILSTCFFILIQFIFYFQAKYHYKIESNDITQDQEKKSKKLHHVSQKINQFTIDKDEQLLLLEDREQYRREFLGNVSHELKTPLFTIQGYILTLIEGAVNDKKVRDKYLNRINKTVDRLIYIVKDLDLLSELEKGKIQLHKSSFNIVALTKEVYDLLEIKAQNLKVNLLFDTTYPNPIKVYGDIEKIEQVLTNLISNAISYSEKEGANVTISFHEIDENIQVQISDNGKGIKEENLYRIFERFYRVDTTRSRNHGGSGLGLAIVKHILEAHHQKIFVESKYKKGTTFIFTLLKSKE